MSEDDVSVIKESIVGLIGHRTNIAIDLFWLERFQSVCRGLSVLSSPGVTFTPEQLRTLSSVGVSLTDEQKQIFRDLYPERSDDGARPPREPNRITIRRRNIRPYRDIALKCLRCQRKILADAQFCPYCYRDQETNRS